MRGLEERLWLALEDTDVVEWSDTIGPLYGRFTLAPDETLWLYTDRLLVELPASRDDDIALLGLRRLGQ
jgi:hypothetical protein